ncbi:hypothetical protein KA005_73340 [bacterium]|nr:hypothetical protein [bacterium]
MKKVYRLKNDLKYEIPSDKAEKSFNDFRMYINKRKLEEALNSRKELFKKYKKPKRMNDFVLALLILGFYYFLTLLVIFLSRFGFM